MSPIKNTELFKSLLSLTPDQEDEVELALANVAVYTNVNWDDPDPQTAFAWVLTPQGRDYWGEYHQRYEERQI